MVPPPPPHLSPAHTSSPANAPTRVCPLAAFCHCCHCNLKFDLQIPTLYSSDVYGSRWETGKYSHSNCSSLRDQCVNQVVICHALQIPFITQVLCSSFLPVELRLNIDTGHVQFRLLKRKELSDVEENAFTSSLTGQKPEEEWQAE